MRKVRGDMMVILLVSGMANKAKIAFCPPTFFATFLFQVRKNGTLFLSPPTPLFCNAMEGNSNGNLRRYVRFIPSFFSFYPFYIEPYICIMDGYLGYRRIPNYTHKKGHYERIEIFCSNAECDIGLFLQVRSITIAPAQIYFSNFHHISFSTFRSESYYYFFLKKFLLTIRIC